MKLQDIKNQIQKYQYLEDTGIIDVTLATIVANTLKLANPVWLIIIGASSGGKSQIVSPINQSNPGFIHKIDDVTENTFLSGLAGQDDDKTSPSLLKRIGSHGIISISDFTVIMSKNGESRAAILSQFRMIYDGSMVKHSGNKKVPITWNGYVGVIAGSTPSIYSAFEEVADMGERFVYYRMKEFSAHNATMIALSRTKHGKELDTELAELYKQYLQAVYKKHDGREIELSPTVKQRIIEVASFAEKARTPIKTDFKGEHITKIPVSAFPMRVALQLMAIAKALAVINYYENDTYDLGEEQLRIIDWVGYSLANEEKRAVLKIFASIEYGEKLKPETIANEIGLSTFVVGLICQNLTAIGVLKRSTDGVLMYAFKDEKDYNVVRRIEHIVETIVIENVADSIDGYHSEAELEADMMAFTA